MKLLPIVVLNWCSYVIVSLYRLHVPNAFGGKAGLDVDASHVFPQGVLPAVTFVGDGAGDGGARACTGCEAGLLSTQWSSPHCQWWGLIPRCWSRSPEVQA